MPSRESTRADSRRNRQLILDAAAATLLHDPGASISDVAEQAGLTRATVYRHYADRDALLQALARASAMHLVPQILAEMRPLPWHEAMELLATRAISLSASYRDLILSLAPHLERVTRGAVEDEPIHAEITARRAAGEFDSPCSDAWLALCVRTLCLAAIGQLTDPKVDEQALIRHLATTLGGLVEQPRFTP